MEQQRYTPLAEAKPGQKYGWRSGEGVRTVGEVYAHIAGANFGITRAFGTAPPAGFEFKSVMAHAGDKPKLMQALKDSFGISVEPSSPSTRRTPTKPRRCSAGRPR